MVGLVGGVGNRSSTIIPEEFLIVVFLLLRVFAVGTVDSLSAAWRTRRREYPGEAALSGVVEYHKILVRRSVIDLWWPCFCQWWTEKTSTKMNRAFPIVLLHGRGALDFLVGVRRSVLVARKLWCYFFLLALAIRS